MAALRYEVELDGVSELHTLQDKWEVGWLLDRQNWGRGLATEGARPHSGSD
jgi:RimJ/RimL family protein N-acetyltransferase